MSCSVTPSCWTLSWPKDYSPPGPSVHGIFPGKNTGVGCHFLLQGIFPAQRSNPADSLPLSHLGSPYYMSYEGKFCPEETSRGFRIVHTLGTITQPPSLPQHTHWHLHEETPPQESCFSSETSLTHSQRKGEAVLALFPVVNVISTDIPSE